MTVAGWTSGQLGDLAEIIRGVTYQKTDARAELAAGLVPLLRATNITDHLVLDRDLVYVPARVVKPHQMLRLGDVVLAASSGSASVVGKNRQLAAPWAGTFGAFCAVVRPGPEVDRRYLALFLSSPAVRSLWSDMARGTNINNLKRGDLADTSVPLPPLDEQRRIVDLLDDHVSRLHAATAGAQRALRRLNSLEQSVLSDCYEAGDLLLPLGSLAAIQGGIQKQPKRAPAGNAFPFLRVANVTARGLELEDVHRVELFAGELDKLRLEAGDLLVVEGNGSPSQIGRAALWEGQLEDCVHQNHLIRVRPTSEVEPAYLEAIWNAPQNRRQLTDLASSSSGLHTLSVGKLKALKIPLAEAAAQRQVIDRVGAIRSVRGRLQADLAAAVARASHLRRALLTTAFSGELSGHQPPILRGSDV